MKNISSKSVSRSEVRERENDHSTLILRIMALFGLSLMLFGLVDGLSQTGSFSFPGPPTMSIEQIAHTYSSEIGLVMMSVGIILFALLPSLRVLLGIYKFIHNREIVNLIIATFVLLELTVSFLLIFGVKGALI